MKTGYRRLFTPPVDTLRTLASESEHVLAIARVGIVLLLLIAPVYKVLRYPESAVFTVGLGILLAAFAISLGIWYALRRFGYHSWMGLAFSALDGSCVTAALLSFLLLHNPLTALNSIVTFEVYFLVIAATALRFDSRAALFTGLLVTAQYAGLWLFGALAWDLTDPELVWPGHRNYQWFDQMTRVMLLLSATMLALLVVVRIQSLVRRAIHDSLTGCFTRRYFDSHARNELMRAQREKSALTFVMIDVDHFKSINDRFGHPVGDKVLKRIAHVVQRQIRGGDMLARYGGEEFVLAFTEQLETMQQRIESIREYVENETFRAANSALNVTISAGVSVFPRDGDTLEKLLEVADRRLLRAKADGRNRVVFND